jgi:Ca-activated chloride channel family protein
MKLKSVALFSLAGMLLTSASVYTLAGGEEKTAIAADRDDFQRGATRETTGGTTEARFSAGRVLMVEGRLGHERIARSSRGETYLMLEVRGGDVGEAQAAPAALSLVIDRSGSMRGSRLDNAIRAATAAVDRLHDGDVVSVVTFDTATQVVVPPTTIGPGSRERIAASLRGISLGGDTCLSCGIEQGLADLRQATGLVSRMLVLSDGDANRGVRDVPGFRGIASRARDLGVGITTIGVDVEYNEKILSAIAQESNGRHYFVENDASLERVFEQEAEAVTASIASGTEATIALAPGVELERVLDRTFRRSGRSVVVPLGSFARGEVKTVLLKVRVPSDVEGRVPVADVELRYRDLEAGAPSSCAGSLAAVVTSSPGEASELDPVVEGRAQRSETAEALKEANRLFELGQLEGAKKRLEERASAVASVRQKAELAAPAAKAKDVSDDFQRQLAALDQAQDGFASPPAAAAPAPGGFASPPVPPQATRAGKGAIRKNEAEALDLAF